MTKIILAITVLLHLTSLCFGSHNSNRDTTKEYLGCYQDNSLNKLFDKTPGEYLPNNLSPLSCMLACGKQWPFAGIENGRLCLCSAAVEPSNFIKNEECSVECPGTEDWPANERKPSCGGNNRISVYDVRNRIRNLQINDPGSTTIYENLTIEATVSNGKGATFKYTSTDSDAVATTISTSRVMSHIYNIPGSYKVKVEATNNVSGTHSAERIIKITDQPGNGTINCQYSQVLGKDIECTGSFKRGSPLETEFDFGDGAQEMIHSNVEYGSVGIQQTNGKVKDVKRSKRFTTILPQTNFQADSTVYAWEIDALSVGRIYLQIFRPKCVLSERYCDKLHSCLPQSSSCSKVNEWECAANEIFCFLMEKCIPASELQSATCKQDNEYNFAKIPADYELVTQETYMITSSGRQLLELRRPMLVQHGDLIGWTSDGGEIQYEELDENEPPEISYKFISTVNYVLTRSEGTLKHQRHIISAHFINPSSFYLRHKYASPGAYYITSALTQAALVYVDIPVRDFKIKCPVFKLTLEKFLIMVMDHVGSNITYQVNFDNGTVHYQRKRTFEYFYGEAGTYMVNMTAMNSVSLQSDACLIKIYDDITSLNFSDLIEPVALQQETVINWCIKKGTNVTYLIEFGDQSSESVSNFRNGNCHSVKHTYVTYGRFNVKITAKNDIGTVKSIEGIALVDIPIGGMEAHTNHNHLTKNVYLAPKEKLEVIVSYSEGTNIMCKYDLGDGTQPYVTDKLNAQYSYDKVGTYHINVICYNLISSASKLVNATIVVEELTAITDLKILVPQTVFGQEALISATMATGSLYFCDWNFGDGNKLKVDSSIFDDIIRHDYAAVGDYAIKLSCGNSLGTVTAEYQLPIEIPIKGFGILCPHKYQRVDDILSFHLAAGKGSRLSYTITFGDGKEETINNLDAMKNNSATFKHKYKEPGEYNVTINAKNQIDSVTDYCLHNIIVETPVQGITISSNSPLKFDPGEVQFYLNVSDWRKFPTNARINWNYGDSGSMNGIPLIKEYNVNSYKYKRPGVYKVTVEIYNNVSTSKSIFLDVDVQKIIPVSVSVKQKDKSIDILHPGSGKNQKYFALENILVAEITKQPKDLQYLVNFNDGVMKTSDSNVFSHRYKVPGSYIVSATVKNMLGDFFDSKEIILQESISNMLLIAPNSVEVGEELQLAIVAEKFGSDVCGMVSFGDDHMYVLNNVYCKNKSRNALKNYTYLSRSDDGPINFTYTYQRKGLYNISLTVMNEVSSFVSETQIEVTYMPCPKPEVHISERTNVTHPRRVVRSKGIVLQSNVTAECAVADNVTFWWKVFKMEDNKLIEQKHIVRFQRNAMPFQRRPGTFDPSVFEIIEHVLPYGIVKIELSIIYESKSADLSEFVGKDETWFRVTPSDLSAVIEGGIRRAIGFNATFQFDASKTYDPDGLSRKSPMKYEWYCRRSDEVFPDLFDLVNPTDETAGCFKNGLYLLKDGVSEFKNENEDGSKISLKMNLMKNETYIIRVFVTQDNRRGMYDQEILITEGIPPSLKLYCTYNCFQKLTPSEPFKVQSICSNCDSSTKVFYQWQLYLLETQTNVDGESIIVEKEIKDLPLKTTTSVYDPNISLKKNVLEFGQDYILKVSAWKATSSKANGGFGEFKFTVNTHPLYGFCDVSPLEGVTLTTVFLIKCGSWVDEDTPLSYKIDIAHGGSRQNLYSGFEQEVSMILPLGDEKNGYAYDLLVTVEDSLSFGITQRFKVKVKEPVTVDFDAVSNNLESLAKEGNLQELSQMAFAAGAVMNKNSERNSGSSKNDQTSSTADKEKETRTKIIASLSLMKPCTLNEIRQMSGVQTEMTKTAAEISPEAQEQSGNALDSMSDCMLQARASSPGMDDTANTMFMASSNALSVGFANQKNVSNITGKASTDKTLDTVNKVGGALMRQMVTGDKPKVLKTATMDMEMSQVNGDSNGQDVGFEVPNVGKMLGNGSSLAVTGRRASIGAMVTSMKDNPYKGVEGSDDLKSDVMGLALSGPDGKPIDLMGQEMTMFVKRDLANDDPAETYTYDVNEGAMKVHRVNFTSNVSYLAIEIRPVDEHVNTSVFMSYEKRPTVSNLVTSYSQPSLNFSSSIQKLPEPYIQVFSAVDLNGTGEYYIGIKLSPGRDDIFVNYGYKPTMNYTLRTWESVCKVWNEDEKVFTTYGCKVGPKTTFNRTHCICKIGAQEGGTEAKSSVSTSSSLPSTPSVANGNSSMAANGVVNSIPASMLASATASALQSSPLRKRKVTRATFAGGFFVAPNPIDFSKAFAGFANLAENPVAFATVLSILGVYLLLLFWARREDRKDIERAGVTALPENDPTDRQFFEITVFTGFTGQAATTSNVYFQLSGDEGEGEVRQLKDLNRKLFQKRAEDVFLVSYPDEIGDVSYLRIWHDNTGKDPSWYLSRVMVHDLNADRKFLFINDNAIAVEEGDGSLERVLPVAGPEEIKSFNHLFFSTTQKNLTDNHIWFSVFIRPPKSRFTRVQRLSCCLTLLYCTMVTNAMFYQVGGESNPSTTLHVGPFAFSLSQIGIGIMTSLIIFPVNILIVGVFRSIRPKPPPEEMAKKKTDKWWWLRELFFCCSGKKTNEFIDLLSSKDKSSRVSMAEDSLSDLTTLDGSTIGLKMETEAQEQRRVEKEKKVKKQKKKLPYWMKYFAWTLLILTSFTSAFFVVLYGFQFGKEKSAQWLSALFISFVQDVCISQPTKILGLALFIALIVKKPAEDEEEEGDSNKKQVDEEYLHNKADNGEERKSRKPDQSDIIRFQPPSKEKVAALRSYRLKELKMYSLIRDIGIYLIFVVALCQVSYSHLDPRSYNLRRSMDNIFGQGAYGRTPAFHDIQNVNDVWPWLNETVVNGLYSMDWYNNMVDKPGFVKDRYANLFGGSRLRQLRVKNDSCTIHEDFHAIIDHCHDWYSWSEEETGQYDPGWKLVTNESLRNPPKHYGSWEYKTSSELDTYPFVGSVSTYRGGGYIGDMGKSTKISYDLLNNLHKNKWLDDRTRALFLEVTVYNAQVNLFAIMNFVVEFTPINGAELFKSIKIARLYTFGGSAESFTLACQFFVLIFFLITIYRESKKIYREKKQYFKGFWNLMEFVIGILVITTISVFFSRMMLVDRAIKKIEQNPGKFVSFNKVTQWDVIFSALTSVLVLLSCIKSIRMLQYNKTISLLASTLKGCAKPLAAFSVVFVIFFIAFTTFAYLLFVPYLADYKNFVTASESVMSLLLGGFKFGLLKETKPVLGPIWFALIMLFGVMYIMNVFLSIIMETYAAVKDDLAMQSQEYELVAFMYSKFLHMVGKGDGGIKAAMAKFDEKEKSKMEERQEKQSSAKFSKKSSNLNRKNYYQLFDDEIEMKFAQLDDSLNGVWLDHCNNERTCELIETRYHGNAFANPGFEFDEVHEDMKMKQNLRDELTKWL